MAWLRPIICPKGFCPVSPLATGSSSAPPWPLTLVVPVIGPRPLGVATFTHAYAPNTYAPNTRAGLSHSLKNICTINPRLDVVCALTSRARAVPRALGTSTGEPERSGARLQWVGKISPQITRSGPRAALVIGRHFFPRTGSCLQIISIGKFSRYGAGLPPARSTSHWLRNSRGVGTSYRNPCPPQTAKSPPHPDLITATLATRVEALPNIEY